MEIKFDTYSLRARVLPAYITLAPVILFFVTVAPAGFNYRTSWLAALISVTIPFLLSQVVADFGKRLEKSLWSNWGGPPTTRFLRHGNTEFNEATRRRVHRKLRQHGLTVPTCAEQDRDEGAADIHYQSCAEDLIRRTRNTKRFPLIYNGLTEYGFRRNLLGLKGYGVSLAIIGVIVSAWASFSTWDSNAELTTASVVASLISIGLFLIWLIWVTERTVKLSADRYARFLLETTLEL